LGQSTASPAYQLIRVTSRRVLAWNPGCAIQSDGASFAMISAQRLCRLAVLDGLLRVEGPADAGTVVAADIPLPA
jgi:hypothetical protein